MTQTHSERPAWPGSPWSDHAWQRIVAAFKAGASVQTPGSRAHSSYHWLDGWYRDDFDESRETSTACSEQEVMRLASEQPALFQPLLRYQPWRAFCGAAIAGEKTMAIKHLDAWREAGGAPDTAAVLAAWLCPPSQPDDRLAALVSSALNDYTAVHTYLSMLRWQSLRPGREHAAAYLEVLLAIATPGSVSSEQERRCQALLERELA